MHPLLQIIDHRPWPLSSGPWIMKQSWHDLLFAHWPIDRQRMRAHVPAELELDSFNGQCWLGIVPFRMSGVRGRGLPPFPRLSRFPELNVRTYVRHHDKRGVYFFSLDAASLLAVWAARISYHLPYFYASMRSLQRNGEIRYCSRRREAPAEFRARYQPTSEPRQPGKGSLAHWLIERYCLYTVHQGRVYCGEIHHPPWPLQDATAEFETNTMARAARIDLPDTAPLLHFSRRLDVLIWPLRHADKANSRV